jgi:hypothetical protein
VRQFAGIVGFGVFPVKAEVILARKCSPELCELFFGES